MTFPIRQATELLCRYSLAWAVAYTLSCAIHANALAQAPERKQADRAAEEPAPKADQPSYAELKVDEKLSRYRNSTIPRMLRGTDPMTPTFEGFFSRFFFPAMTRLENIEKLPELRDELAEMFDRAVRNADATNQLNQLTYEMMYAIVVGPYRAIASNGKTALVYRREDEKRAGKRYFLLEGKEIPGNAITLDRRRPAQDFHPAVKYNAMLIIGQLNDKQATARTPATPRLKSLPPLLRIGGHPNAPQALRVAALIGVIRHAETKDLDAGIKGLIANRMLEVLSEKPPAHMWIRRRAVDVLGALAIPGPQYVVVDKLTQVITDRQNPVALRAAAAEALGKISLSGPPKGGARPVADQLGKLAVDASLLELSGDGAQGFSGDRLAATLTSISMGLEGGGPDAGQSTGLSAVADGDGKNFIGGLVQHINEIKSHADTGESPADDGFKRELTRSIDQLTAYLKGGGSAVAPGPSTPGGTPIEFPE